MAQPRQIYASTLTRRERGWGRSRRRRAFVLSPVTRILGVIVAIAAVFEAFAGHVI